MTELDFENDQKLKTLTEALRAGPGSPQWRQAVSEWRSAGVGESEHQLLMRVREHLASGKSYREVRAGAGFTRRVMDQIDEEQAQRAVKSPGAGWIATISVLVLVGVIASIAYFVWPRGAETQPAAPRLDRTYFVATAATATFVDSIAPQWQTFGNLTLIADEGLRAAIRKTASSSKSPAQVTGGGAYWDRPLGPQQPFSIECAIQIDKPATDAMVQVFVTDNPHFEGASAITSHELVWTLKNGEASVVLPDGSVAGTLARLGPGPEQGKPHAVDVRIVVNQQQALVEVNQQKLWSGANQLSPSRSRTIGVRFLMRGDGGRADGLSVKSVRVMQPEQPKTQLDEAVVE